MESKQITKSTQFDTATVKLIKNTVAIGATDDELKLFLYQASRAQLDPLARQIYFVKRGGKVTIQTSIDGFRLIAERSGKYAGQDEPVFEDKEGKPSKCSVAVYKFSETGLRYKAAVGVAYWDEYYPAEGQNFMWKKMPRTMLSKVAEAKALRQAFPQDLSGLYTSEEIMIDTDHEEGNPFKEALMTDFQMNRIIKAGKKAEISVKKLDEYIHDQIDEDWPDKAKITVSKANKIAESLESYATDVQEGKVVNGDFDPDGSLKI